MMIPFDSKEIVIALKAIKEQTGFSNIAIAEELDFNNNTVTTWLSGQTLPSRKSCKKLQTFIETYGVHGIIELPPHPDHWLSPYFICVADIENPFFTWYENFFYTGNDPEQDCQMMEDYYQLYKEHKINYTPRLIYPNHTSAMARARTDISNYNYTITLLESHLPTDLMGQDDLAQDIVMERYNAKP